MNEHVRVYTSGRTRAIVLSRDQLEGWAGGPMTDQDVERLAACIPGSSIPEAIGVIASDALGLAWCAECGGRLIAGEGDADLCGPCTAKAEAELPATAQAGAGVPQVRRTCSCGTAWADEPGHDDETAGGGLTEEAGKAREFIQWAAQNSIVADDFTQGNEAFNQLVRAARALAAELGITYQPGEGPPEEEISAEEYEAWPGNQPGGTATAGSP